MVTAEYKLQGETLRGMMQLCVELQSVTGMAPDKITIEDGHRVDEGRRVHPHSCPFF